jgi:hypothetical protein
MQGEQTIYGNAMECIGLEYIQCAESFGRAGAQNKIG